VFSTPTVVGDSVVVSSCNGMIRALDNKTGQVKWSYDIRKDGEHSQFHGDPLVTDEFAIIGTDGKIGHVYAFERSPGAVRWKYRVDKRGVASDIVRLEGNVFAVTLGDELVSLDLKTGKPNWTFRAGYSAQDCLTCSSPVAAEGHVYFGGLDGFAYALNSQTGKLIWKRDLGAKLTTSAAIRGHDLYLGTVKRHLYRLNIDSGEVLSDFVTDAAPNGRLIASDDSLFTFLGDEIFASIDLNMKTLRWSAEASKEWTSARPYLWHGKVLAGNRRELVAFAATDGTRVWSHQFPETVRGIGTSDEVLYVGSLKGPIFAYRAKP
jgi:outer membrane protein assembly factor BamB